MKRTLKPVFPPAGIESEYRKRLQKAVRKMEKSCVYWLRARYRANEDKILDSATSDLLQAFRRLLRQWERNFRELADTLPRWFVSKIRGYVTRNLAEQTRPLRDAGLGFNLKFSYMSQKERQTFAAIVAENVSLIKSIARESLTQVEGIVLRSIEDGHDLATLTERLHHQFGVSERRAAMIARDQTNKATNNLSRQRLLSYGVTKGIWMHTSAGKTYRETHELDHTHGGMNGAEYFISEGCYDPNPNVQDYIQPGELVNCRCVCRPLIPTLTEEETEAGIEEILKEVEGNDIMTSKEDALSMVHREYAVVPENGSDNAFTVDYSVVNSKAFHDKFDGLTEHKAVNESLYKKAAEFLVHRNGTPYEDIAMLDSRTGEVLAENKTAGGIWKFRCGLTAEQTKVLDATGKYFEIVHNHPNSSIPSVDDVCGLFNRPKAVGSTIFCHNGTVYRMKKVKPFPRIDELVKTIRDDVILRHSNYDKNQVDVASSSEVLTYLKQHKYLRYVER